MRYANTAELLMDLKKVGGAGISQGVAAGMANPDMMDSRTQILPVIDEEKLEKSKAVKETKKKDATPKKPKEKPKYSKKVTALAVILSLLLVSSVAMGYLYSKGLFGGREVAVPSVVGMTESEAITELEGIGLVLNVKDTEPSDEYEEGQVTRQDPEEGSNLKKGAVVDVYLSEGPEIEEIRTPSLLGETLDSARSIIRENELELGEVLYEYSSEAEGTVISQTPRVGNNVEKGTTVDLIVSKGEELSEVSVPNLVGLSLDNAKNRLSASGLSVGSVSEEFSNRSAGTVLFQGLESGAKVEQGTSVNLVVSKGPEPKPEEPEEDQDNNNTGENTGDSSQNGSETEGDGSGSESPTSPGSESGSGN